MKKLRQLTKLTLLLTLAMTLPACSPYILTGHNVQSSANIAAYKTFTMLPIDTDGLPRTFKLSSTEALTDAVAAQLKSRGYRQVYRNGDIGVSVSLSSKRSIVRSTDISGTGSRTLQRNAGNTRIRGGNTASINGSFAATATSSSEVVTDGIITMDIKDMSNNRNIYYAEISASTDFENLILRDYDELIKATDKLFKKYPVSRKVSKK